MRIVSWMVVIASVSALSWLGLQPLLPKLDVQAEHAVGTTVANTVRASIEVAQAELEEQRCEESRDGAAGRDNHGDPVRDKQPAKSAKPSCEQ